MLSYSVSKSAVDQITRCLAKQLAPEGIRVNAVNPGGVPTNIGRDFKAKDTPASKDKDEDPDAGRHILGRLGTPKDIAEGVGYLASEDAAWVTGTILVIDGGFAVS